MFMRQGVGAPIKIQPQGLNHYVFKNVAKMCSLVYFRAHARIIPLEHWTEGRYNNQITARNRREEVMKSSLRVHSNSASFYSDIITVSWDISRHGIRKYYCWELNN